MSQVSTRMNIVTRAIVTSWPFFYKLVITQKCQSATSDTVLILNSMRSNGSQQLTGILAVPLCRYKHIDIHEPPPLHCSVQQLGWDN